MPSLAFLRRLREIRDHGSEPSLEPAENPIVDARLLEARCEIGAVRLHGPLGELWVCLDPCALPRLVAEEAALEVPRPVLLAEDVARLRGKSDEAIQGALEVIRSFPGGRVLQ
jgi:hypothetical protein